MHTTSPQPGELNFYPRSPRGERPPHARRSGWSHPISIHAPREGSDHGIWLGDAAHRRISIHAPREGSDGRRDAVRRGTPYFYPRSPRGERLVGKMHTHKVSYISIHAPREGSDADADRTQAQFKHNFYPRSPRGERRIHDARSQIPADFYPRSPRGERREAFPSTYGGLYDISIHAPREGSDGTA